MYINPDALFFDQNTQKRADLFWREEWGRFQ